MYFAQREYERRWEAVYDRMAALGIEVAVIWSRSGGTHDRCADVLYLTNYYSTSNGQIADTAIYSGRSFSCVVMANREMPALHIDEPMPRVGELATDRVEYHAHMIEGVAKALKRGGVEGRVAFVGTEILPVKYARELEQLVPAIEWEDCTELIEDVRHIKSPAELDCYREAGEIASRAAEVLIAGLVAGDSEADAAGAAAKEVLSRGGQFHMIPVNHGDTLLWWTRDAIAQSSRDRPAVGDMVRGFVLVPIFQGYWLDPGRTAVCGGKPSAEQRRLIEGTVEIIEACADAIRPGVSVLEVARLGDRLTREHETETSQIAELVPLFGHGIGLFWENPYIGEAYLDGSETFEAGMVLGIEAFLGRAGAGYTAMESNYIVGDDGLEPLISTPMIWH
jgi:Xaa-Pro aminopeptidase